MTIVEISGETLAIRVFVLNLPVSSIGALWVTSSIGCVHCVVNIEYCMIDILTENGQVELATFYQRCTHHKASQGTELHKTQSCGQHQTAYNTELRAAQSRAQSRAASSAGLHEAPVSAYNAEPHAAQSCTQHRAARSAELRISQIFAKRRATHSAKRRASHK